MKNIINTIRNFLGILFFGCAIITTQAQENIVTNPIPNNPLSLAVDQSGTLAAALNSTNGVFKSIYKGAGDALAYVEGVSNGYARVTFEGFYLMTKHEGNGGGGAIYFPVSGTNNVLGAGFGVAYLNKNWYDATLSARLGTLIPLPLNAQKIFPLYGYVESGGGWNFGTQVGIAQAFTGASLHYSLFRTSSGNTVDFTTGYSIGTISDIRDNVQAGGGSFTVTF